MMFAVATIERFWAKVDKRGTDECWNWQGANINGRGTMRVRGRNFLSPRVSWEIHNGPIPNGLHVCHHCDNPACVNPAHLFVGDKFANMADCVRKGRTSRGMKNGHCKLTAEQVAEIRRAPGYQRDIAQRFGISPSYVSELKSEKKRIYAE